MLRLLPVFRKLAANAASIADLSSKATQLPFAAIACWNWINAGRPNSTFDTETRNSQAAQQCERLNSALSEAQSMLSRLIRTRPPNPMRWSRNS